MTDKQPEALKWADAAQSAHMPQLAEFLRTQHAELMQLRAEVAALSANALDDCRHIERKDALLRQALEAFEYQMKPLCMCFAGCAECDPATAPNIDQIEYAIKQELSQ